jgi:excisionase family DNA binding protein
MPNEIVTTAELAERLRFSREHVRDLARKHLIPSMQVVPRGRRLFNVAEVLESLRGAAGPAAPGPAAPPAGPDR